MSEEMCEQKSSSSTVDGKHRSSVSSGDSSESCKGRNASNKERKKGRISGGDMAKIRKDNWRRYAKKYIKAEVYMNKFEPGKKWQNHVNSIINDETFLENAEKGFLQYDSDEKDRQDDDECRTSVSSDIDEEQGGIVCIDEKQMDSKVSIPEGTSNEVLHLGKQVNVTHFEASTSAENINCIEKQISPNELEVEVNNKAILDAKETCKVSEEEDKKSYDNDEDEDEVLLELKAKLASQDDGVVQASILEMVGGRKEEKDRICACDNKMKTIDEETELTELQLKDTKCSMEGTQQHIEHEIFQKPCQDKVEKSLDTKFISHPQVGITQTRTFEALERETFVEADEYIVQKDQEVDNSLDTKLISLPQIDIIKTRTFAALEKEKIEEADEHIVQKDQEVDNSLGTKFISLPQIGVTQTRTFEALEREKFEEADEHIVQKDQEVDNSLDTKFVSLPQVGITQTRTFETFEKEQFEEDDEQIVQKDQEVEWIEEREKIDDLMRELLLD